VQASVVPFNAVPNALIITVNEFPEFAEMLAPRSLHKKRADRLQLLLQGSRGGEDGGLAPAGVLRQVRYLREA
jgi:hypothetical protein